MSIGTILDDPSLVVQYINGDKLGSLEESFVSRLSPGDHFTFGGKVLEFVRLRDLKVWVRKAKSRTDKGAVPRWYGGGLPISEQLTGVMREKLDRAREGVYDDREMERLRPLLDLQARLSRIPAPDELLIESVKTREGHHLFFYPFAGRLVHEGLAALIAYRIAREIPVTFTYAINDYGFELLSADVQAITPETDVRALFSTADLLDDIHASLNMSEMSKRQFREVARVSGLVTSRFPGGQKTVKQLQASSSLIYDVLEKYDRENLLLAQAEREVLQRQLEQSRLYTALDRINAGDITIQPVKRPTPFCFPLLVDRLRQTVTSETLEDRIKKMQMSYEW
jgi:ATP-dependent Lhr-like helicase